MWPSIGNSTIPKVSALCKPGKHDVKLAVTQIRSRDLTNDLIRTPKDSKPVKLFRKTGQRVLFSAVGKPIVMVPENSLLSYWITVPMNSVLFPFDCNLLI
ncbi:hypothetical protein CFP56_033112 [Quercus suber]|uniref:Uncharacterized protein n=1 Tax=Quercus suber TaxID=58331 RepID=A0AAW0JGN3_QUESU